MPTNSKRSTNESEFLCCRASARRFVALSTHWLYAFALNRRNLPGDGDQALAALHQASKRPPRARAARSPPQRQLAVDGKRRRERARHNLPRRPRAQRQIHPFEL